MADHAKAPEGPFAGVRVIEFGRFIAVPYCGQLLADGGADVIKIEPLSGDQARGNGMLPTGDARQFLNKNRGKRSCAMDLSRPELARPLAKLVDSADVVLVNFRPGVAERLGLDYATLSARNPRLIYAENTAFGLAGPRGGAIGVDMAVQAYSGLWHATPVGPQPVTEPIIDYMAAMLMSFGVATALYHRERTGRGQRLDTALLQAAMLLQNNHLLGVEGNESWRGELIDWLKNAMAEGVTWDEIVNHRAEMSGEVTAGPYYGILRTSDGYIAVGAGGADMRVKVRSLVEKVLPGGGDPGGPPRPDEVRSALASRTSAEWLAKLGAVGVPAAPLQFREELLDDPQPEANGFLARVQHPRLGELVAVGPPLQMSDTPFRPGDAPPDLGADTADVLSELGLSAEEIDKLAADGTVLVAGGSR